MKIKTRYRILRVIASFLVLNMVLEIAAPVASYALTSGPSQPEVQSFEPVGTTEMVDLFTGDFTYNIPLFELPGPNGGYPFNLHYNSGSSMDQEASWVGLGWNLNPGAITRQMRGLPDEFNGNMVSKKMDMRPNVSFGVGVGADVEVFGADLKEGIGLNVSASISIYYNNYKGVGYSVGAGISASMIKGENGGMSSGLGLNLSLDSQEGVGQTASISFKDKVGESTESYSIGIGYSSRSGLTGLTLSMDVTSNDKTRPNDATQDNNVRSSIGSTASLSFAQTSYVPSVSMPMRGRNINLQFKMGGTLFGLNANGMVNGFFSTQYLKDAGQTVQFPAYGYLNMQNKNSERVMLDFNREKDGPVRENSPNLAIPTTTADIYSVTAQGMAGTYRAFRNDIGVLHDTEEKSNTAGGALGIEIGPGSGPEIGADVTLNYSESKSGRWNSDNNVKGLVDFRNTADNNLYEAAYFKPYGEHTADPSDELTYIYEDEPVSMELLDVDSKKFQATGKMIRKSDGASKPFSQPTEAREPRNNVLRYRKNDPSKGMESIGPDGTRYIYEKIAQNAKQVECMYSPGPQNEVVCKRINISDNGAGEPVHDAANTDQFLSRTEMNNFPYAYLLTAVLGPDYIDVDGNGEVSIADAGYWVKFNYETTVNYNWRAPLKGANYIQGLRTTFEDDRASYMYGEKQIHYLTSVETKTHIAVFETSARRDGFGAAKEIQGENESLGTAAQQYLKSIKLYSREDLTKTIKAVKFSYNYSLCKGVENYKGAIEPGFEGGKLTLAKVEFTYGTSNRGRLSPYVFHYTTSGSTYDENPNYDQYAYDRWGNYKPASDPNTGVTCNDIDFPYVKQFDNTITSDQFKAITNNNASVWNLRKIDLPTGGSIEVEYEADDYAYVQNKRAMQMFKITGFSEEDTDPNSEVDLSNTNRRIYFELEKPIAVGTNARAELDQYFEGVDKLYWNVFMYIRKASDEQLQDYVSGYNDIDPGDWGFDVPTGGKYYRGWVNMQRSVIGTKKGAFKELRYHPFSLAAWQYIRTQNPNLGGVGPFNTNPNSNKSAAMSRVKSLVSLIPEVVRIFQGYNNYADSHDWGKRVIKNKSYIRLNSPDKIKIGGGCRVKKIALHDNWHTATSTAETNHVYGQVYDYSITEDEKTISSGVAINEPQIGADESPLRKAKEYTDAIPLKTNNKLFFEYPVNESYYPGASVGYRKVTVKSLATHYEALNNDPGEANYNIPAGIMTTGATVHEFYTAKEFPVIVDETNIDIRLNKSNTPIPLIGQFGVYELTATQGYSIILNDMHGKLRKVSNYKQNKTSTIDYDAPVSYLEYTYNSETISKDGNTNNDYYKLLNKVNVITGDKGGIVQKGEKYIGQDYEFFTDMREMSSEASSGGLKLNTDVLILGPVTIPAFVPWPNLSYTKNMIRTAVTNKIIHKSGILMETTVYDGESKVNTKNLYFDELTGQPILVSITNNFDAPIYDYTVPAHFVYDGMGPAYKNIGLKFTVSNFATVTGGTELTLSSTTAYDAIVPGDEFITSNNVTGVIVRKLGSNKVFAVMTNTGTSPCTIIRSGRRNLLSANASNIKTLGEKGNNAGNPIFNR